LTEARVPTSTYRLQLRREFGFERAAEVVPYLAALGIGDVYASPVLASTSGSAHGYDGIDPTRIDDERGGAAGFRALVAAVRSHDLGLLVDIVPNHLATSEQNGWWWEVQKAGRGSRHAAAFDIDWDAPGLDGKLLLPVLGGPPGDVLAAGELTLDRDDPRGPVLRYYDRAFPVAPGTESLPLDELVAAQHYELADWHDGPTRINYRRFFDITDLVSLHQEDPAVFEETHRVILGLVADGSITGLRIDHVDGLADPAGYLERLHAAAPELYVVVEKILAADEDLPESWPVAGTTGYEFLDAIGSVLVDAQGASDLDALFARVTGVETPFHEIALAAKREVLAASFPGDVHAVARTLDEPTDGDIAAITAITVELDVYRTYGGNGAPFGDADRARVAGAIERARAADPDAVLDHVGGVLLDGSSATVRRWQQLTGPVAAKGVEDTAIYRYPALVSRDEVGGDPGAAPLTVSALHRRLAARARSWPGALTPLSTHDTKHSEDTRARIGVLASLAGGYANVVERLVAFHDDARLEVSGRLAPSRVDELVLYQNLLGAWPLDDAELDEFGERIVAYMEKAAHEEKLRTSWTDPDEQYEVALGRFAQRAIETFRGDAIPGLRGLRDAVAWYGALDGLSQSLLRLTVPGVPDIYQGCELWNLSLVDPDNRRPVDWELRARLLAAIGLATAPTVDVASDALAGWRDGRLKLLVTARGLHLRRALPSLFRAGDYRPLAVSGERANHVIAFARRHEDAWVIVVVPRLPVGLAPVGSPPLGQAVWGETAIGVPDGAPTQLANALTGELVPARAGTLALADALATLPVALLVSTDVLHELPRTG
jgi:(1->4)-alpha-D-glucan 1-alpha-D-glucosylmutase